MTNNKLRIGIIGLGVGRYHIAGYRQHPNAEVVAVCDVNETVLHQRADEYGVEGRYTSFDEMLEKEKLDIVSVATPNKFHMPLTVQALRAGCHVLCEKPMAMNAQEAQHMLDVAEEMGKRICINFSYRFNEQSQALKAQVDAGLLGDIYYARTIWHRRRGLPGFGGWFGQKALAGGGPLIDLGVHRLDLALWLMGYPKPVWAMGSTYNPIASELARKAGVEFDVEDLAVGMVKFANGASLSIEASWAANVQEREWMETRLFGTKGGLVQHNIEQTYKFEAEMFLELNGAHFDLKLHSTTEKAYPAMYHFVDAIINDRPHPSTGYEGLLVMQILDAIYQSAATGEPVKIG